LKIDKYRGQTLKNSAFQGLHLVSIAGFPGLFSKVHNANDDHILR